MADQQFDIIIAGGGLSGLSLAYYLIEGNYKGSVLIVDKDFEATNDKTWSFWSKEAIPFEEILFKKWDRLRTAALNHERIQHLSPYAYYCIRSGDFKKHVLDIIKKKVQFTLLSANMERMIPVEGGAELVTSEGTFHAPYIFQSAFQPRDLDRSQIRYPLIQHFLGWEIKVNKDIFDEGLATFMDFDASWTPGIAFMYILPWNKREALLEYTIFSPKLEKPELYETKIREYIKHKLHLEESDYKIERKEFGQIPMEDRPYLPWYNERIMNMGTAAGLTKASTGYTFLRIQKHVKKLAQSLIQGHEPVLPTKTKARFWWYDLWLLHVLFSTSNVGIKIFRDLFERNKIQRVLKFLDEDTNFREEIRTMGSVPYWPFIKAVFANLFK